MLGVHAACGVDGDAGSREPEDCAGTLCLLAANPANVLTLIGANIENESSASAQMPLTFFEGLW